MRFSASLCLLGAFIFMSSAIADNRIPVQNDGDGVTGSYNILVIPVEFSNWAHDKPIGADNPYHEPVSIAELSELYNTKARDYYLDVSRNKIDMTFHVFDQWINMGNMEQYAGSAFAPTSLLTGAISSYNSARSGIWQHESYYDKTVIVFAGPSWADEWDDEWAGTGWDPDSDFIHPIAYLAGDNGKANCISAHDGIGVITHELGHAVFNTKDKDVSNRIPAYRFQLVGAGSWNGVNPDTPDVYQSEDSLKNTIPVLISPWNRVNLGWETQPLDLGAGNLTSVVRLAAATDVNAVTNTQSGQRNLVTVNAGGGEYYILENRQKTSWDISLPDWGLLIWKINDNWRSYADKDSGYSDGIWEDVVDAHPETTDQPSDYKYYFIDHRTRAFNSFTDSETNAEKNPLGLFDATLKVGESLTLPGTNVVVRVLESSLTEGSLVELNNVNQNIEDGEPCSDCQPENEAPTAQFNFVADQLTVQFNDQSVDYDGQVVEWLWDFGDGSGSTDASPLHTYSTAGEYSVNLTVSDDDGAQNSTTQSINVSEDIDPSPPPVDEKALQNGIPKTGLSSSTRYEEINYYIDVPEGVSELNVTLAGDNGDVDLYVAFDREASRGDYDKRAIRSGSNESITVSQPEGGRYYIMLRTYREYTDVTLTASYSEPTPPPVIDDYYSSTDSVDIPDNDENGVVSSINVDSTNSASAVVVSLNITHTYKGDLIVTLIAPDATEWVLHDREGGSANNVELEVELSPSTSNVAGEWQLKVQDLASRDTGTLQNWSLGFIQ